MADPARQLGPLAPVVERRLAALHDGDIAGRIWAGDHTVWKPDPAELADRLGWLTIADEMAAEAPALAEFARGVAAEGYQRAVVLGMGGSSLAPEVLSATFGVAAGMLDLTVLDTTDPEQIAGVERELDLRRTLFIVASKSGATIETLSQLDYFWGKAPRGDHYIAITDPATPLEALARARGFRRVFTSPPRIGGRYSALSYFGLVPAALAGIDIAALLARAIEMAQACRAGAGAANPGAWLGAVMGEAALAGRDKLTLLLPPQWATLGGWIEQLVAESTGKEGRGIVPIDGEPLGPPGAYGNDRLFVAIGEHAGLDTLAAAGHPVVRLPYDGAMSLGAEFFRWEFATAIAAHVLGVQPFDQPDVQATKDATSRILAAAATPPPASGDPGDALRSLRPGDYVAILAYLPRTAANDARLRRARLALRARLRVATTSGYGPRFLHSTGQLHKGGPDTGVFLQVVGDVAADLPIPGRPYTFGELQAAQALGDYESLTALGRRVVRLRPESLDSL